MKAHIIETHRTGSLLSSWYSKQHAMHDTAEHADRKHKQVWEKAPRAPKGKATKGTARAKGQCSADLTQHGQEGADTAARIILAGDANVLPFVP